MWAILDQEDLVMALQEDLVRHLALLLVVVDTVEPHLVVVEMLLMVDQVVVNMAILTRLLELAYILEV
jgi:hypothetical protein